MHISTIIKREFASYFATPVAYVFLVIFLVLQGMFTFYMGAFYEREQADLVSFFTYQPWLFLFLIPAIGMRLWAEERKSGTFELLLTLPVPLSAIVIGKYLAAFLFAAFALLLTFPIWVTVNWLGDPDNGVIITGYLGSLLVAGSFLAIGAAMSATTKNQVVAFILSVCACFFFMVSGLPMVLDAFSSWAPEPIVLAISNLSLLTHFDNLQKGVIVASDLVYFGALIFGWLWVNRVVIESKREAG
ncbi:ABC transporter permease subunit [Kordiimonas sp. SCSIO 12603]|uniref:ABC transporter permease subunit n=1 Tax=Kordiimonas sp. SCSIO 12603 TaxID=2829596 RepID=UPI002102EAD4|nr:ABC transporter permease subunit [Kordiimonas sp. SCSIO 12603]UTW59436.1 ABC transporter permease subunit [Kordiimonas sp. SCSIO 12603]